MEKTASYPSLSLIRPTIRSVMRFLSISFLLSYANAAYDTVDKVSPLGMSTNKKFVGNPAVVGTKIVYAGYMNQHYGVMDTAISPLSFSGPTTSGEGLTNGDGHSHNYYAGQVAITASGINEVRGGPSIAYLKKLLHVMTHLTTFFCASSTGRLCAAQQESSRRLQRQQ